MGEFFKGWRRKVGCVTLLMALAMMYLWFRTHFIEDVILSGNGKGTIHSIQLSPSGLMWNRYEGIVMRPGLRWHQGKQKADLVPPRVFLTRETITFTRNSQWYIFGLGEIQDDLRCTMSFWQLPFFSIILPLTLLSAWLILGKRPKPRAKHLSIT